MKKDKVTPKGPHGNGSLGKATTAAPKRGKQDVNLRKRGFLRFQVGLIIALLLVYFGLEASFRMQKEYEPDPGIEPELTTLIQPDVVITIKEEAKRKPIPPKKRSAAKIKIAKGPIEVDPSPFILQPVSGPPSIPIDSIPFEEPPSDENVPYIAVEDKPIFPGCEKLEKEFREACFQEKMNKHIHRTFRYPPSDIALGNQGKVHVFFIIDKDGSITDIEMKGPTASMEKEAARIISKLPKMIPGKQRDKAVKVSFYLPIDFRLRD